MRLGSGLACAVVVLVLAAPASAAPPPNDNRVDARGLELPASVEGTTEEATVEEIDPPSCGFESKGSVWYSLRAASDRRIVVRLRARGDLDAVVDVYRRVRSRLTGVACNLTGEDGEAAFRFDGRQGDSYLIRVAQQASSVPGGFHLDVFSPTAPARLPGARLPRRGVTRVLDRFENSDDAWSHRLRVGRTYRVNLATRARGCMSLSVFRRGNRVRARSCGGYLLFTPQPGEGGRYGFLVEASDQARGPQRYHLQVAPAAGDDTAPGRRMSSSARGRLNGARVDVVDLYRFDILRRADVSLRLSSGADFSASIVGLGGRGYGASARLSRAGTSPWSGRTGPRGGAIACGARSGPSPRPRSRSTGLARPRPRRAARRSAFRSAPARRVPSRSSWSASTRSRGGSSHAATALAPWREARA